MADWEFEHGADCEGTPADVWSVYTEVEQWGEWSEGVEKATIDGPFEDGSTGTVKASSLPRERFELEDVEEERGFITKTKLPGATMRLHHSIEGADGDGGGTRIVHRAVVSGALAPVWSRTVGWIVKRDLPKSVDALAELVPQKAEAREREAEESEKRAERMKDADEKFREEIKKTSGDGGDAGGASLPGDV